MTRLLLVAGLLAGCSSARTAPAPAPLTTDEQKTFYALGLAIARDLKVFDMSQAEVELVQRAIGDSVLGRKPEVALEEWGPKIQGLAQKRGTARAELEKKRSQGFLESAAKEPGAEKTASGLVFRTLTPGNGPSPTAADTVKVHYHGTLTDGTVFDSSVERKEPAEFPLGRVIPCWTEGVQKMKLGEKARLTCPSSIAYGDQGSPPKIPGGATLVFEVELLEIKK